MDIYDVVIWLEWPLFIPEYIEEVPATDGITAVEQVMRQYDVKKAVRVLVRLQGQAHVSRYIKVKLTDHGLEGTVLEP